MLRIFPGSDCVHLIVDKDTKYLTTFNYMENRNKSHAQSVNLGSFEPSYRKLELEVAQLRSLDLIFEHLIPYYEFEQLEEQMLLVSKDQDLYDLSLAKALTFQALENGIVKIPDSLGRQIESLFDEIWHGIFDEQSLQYVGSEADLPVVETAIEVFKEVSNLPH